MCSDNQTTYADTVALMKDKPCPQEDRLILCEFEGGSVQTNLAGDQSTNFEKAFAKTEFQDVVNFFQN